MACTRLLTLYLLGDRSLDTFKVLVFKDLTGQVIVHDRYVSYDSAELGKHLHQLCCAHLLRDLDDAGEVYPGAAWPQAVSGALRELIHEVNLAREAGRDAIDATVRDTLIKTFRHGVLAGLAETPEHRTWPGTRKARLLLEVLRDRGGDVLRFAHDLNVPPTSNQAERDLRPSKIQQKISGRLPSEEATKNRYAIRGYLSTAVKRGLNAMTALREVLLSRPWLPDLPAPA